MEVLGVPPGNDQEYALMVPAQLNKVDVGEIDCPWQILTSAVRLTCGLRFTVIVIGDEAKVPHRLVKDKVTV